jgi:O-antigen/teichoic acid export membrane protein
LLIQVFSALALVVPIVAVASNTLMGIGEARLSFLLSIQLLVASIVIYVAVVPWLGPLGATIGYVAASAFFAWISTRTLRQFVSISALGVIRRIRDVNAFIHNQISSTTSLLRR